MVESLYLPLVLLSSVIGMATGAVAWLHRNRPGARALTAFLVAASLWAVAEGLTVANADTPAMTFWLQVGLSLSVVLPAAWLVLVLEYAGKERWVTRRLLVLLIAEPVVFLALVWTNARHELVFATAEAIPVGSLSALAVTYGVGFWGHQVYTYLLITIGGVVLARLLLGENDAYRRQTTVILGAIAVPVAGNTAHIFGLFPSGLNPTAITYLLAGVILAGILLHSELLGLAPVTREIGREAMLSELDDAVIILDDGDRVVDINTAAERLLSVSADEAVGRALSSLSPALSEQLTPGVERVDIDLERDGHVRHYDVRASSLYRGYGAFSGRLVSLRDVTERRQRQQRLDVFNRLLRHNLRNELNVVRGRMELAKADTGDTRGTERLDEAIETLDGVIARSDKVGRISRLLDRDDAGAVDIAGELRGEYRSGTFDYPGATVTLDVPETLFVTGGPALLAAFKELVANAVEHNDDPHPTVTVTVNEFESDDRQVCLEVRDNGPGIDTQEWQTIVEGAETRLNHSSGVGLWLVNWLVRRAGGTLSFENTTDGCTVGVTVPRAESP